MVMAEDVIPAADVIPVSVRVAGGEGGVFQGDSGDPDDPDFVVGASPADDSADAFSEGSFSGFGSEDHTPIRHRRGRARDRLGRRVRPGRRGVRRQRSLSPSASSDEDHAPSSSRPAVAAGRRRRRRVSARRDSGSVRPPPHSDDDAGWSQDPTPPDLLDFSGRPGMNVPIPTTLLGFLQLFITRELLEYLTVETNSYANYIRNEVRRPDVMDWTPVTVQDIAVFMGMSIIMGFFPAPTRRMYWRRSKLYSMANFAAIMSRHRFEAITRYFHTFNRKAVPRGTTDKLILVRSIMEHLQERFRTTYTPERNISLDEGLMPYKGRLSIKTYNPQKPSKYGVKLYMLCEAKSGYVLDFLTYGGTYSSLKDIVFALVGPYFDQGYHVFMDNYYNSVELAERLYSNGVLCSGTLRLVRGAPAALRSLTQQRVPRNSMHYRRKGNTFVICWQDVRLVTMITTACNAATEEFVHRRRVRRAGRIVMEEVRLQRPVIIGTYCQYMGGVDLFDQLMKYYTMARKGYKWSRKFVMYLLQMALLNAYTLYSKYHPESRSYKLLDFLDEVSELLVNFDPQDWPSSGNPIPHAASLPVDQRRDAAPVADAPHPADVAAADVALDVAGHAIPAAVAVPAAAVAVPVAAVADPVPSPPLPSLSSPPLPPLPSPIDDLSPSTPSLPSAIPGPSHAAAAAIPGPSSSVAPAAVPSGPPAPTLAGAGLPRRDLLVDPPGRLQSGDHRHMKIVDDPNFKTKQRKCQVCKAQGVRKDTSFMCSVCKIPLCITTDRQCFWIYHRDRTFSQAPGRSARPARRRRAQPPSSQ